MVCGYNFEHLKLNKHTVQIYDFIKYMNEYNLYVIYSFKRIRQSFDSSLGFDVWWLDLFE